MGTSKHISALLFICMLSFSSISPILCLPIDTAKSPKHKGAPVVYPPIIKPPPVITPPIIKPPTVITPPITIPPVGGLTTPSTPGYYPPAGSSSKCPANAIKLGACVDLLPGVVDVKLGDPAASKCCPVLEGLLDMEAAVCLCTTLKLKLVSLDVYVPIALKLLVVCGKTPPPGYSCT